VGTKINKREWYKLTVLGERGKSRCPVAAVATLIAIYCPTRASSIECERIIKYTAALSHMKLFHWPNSIYICGGNNNWFQVLEKKARLASWKFIKLKKGLLVFRSTKISNYL